jgi:cytochrome b
MIKEPPVRWDDLSRYRSWMIAVELLLAGLSALRLRGGWHGEFEEWLALFVLGAALVGVAREVRRVG